MRLLDLYCCQGGAAMGYHRAGFEVVGVDIAMQSRYPFEFHQSDAIEYVLAHGHEFDAIHASPPCQAYSKTRSLHSKRYTELIEVTREALQRFGKPYVIENVPGAPLQNPVMLVGTMFGLLTMRPRLFECSFDVPFKLAPPPSGSFAKMGRIAKPGQYMHIAGNGGRTGVVDQWRDAMGIDWMTTHGLSQAIPPAYTEYIGGYLMEEIKKFATA